MKRDFVYLASASPRRRELLSQIGVEFEVRPAAIDETRMPAERPDEYVLRLANAKAEAVWIDIVRSNAVQKPVVAADTTVVANQRVLGQPKTRERALEMLELLSNVTHDVLTAVAVAFSDGIETALCRSKVRFRSTTRSEREAYCDSSEPLDKAGGYAIQGFGAIFIESLSGSYSAVMGLPLYETAALLRRYRLPSWLYRDDAQS